MFFQGLQEDIEAYKARDPAARSSLEIVFLYPGFHALLFYRLSHYLWKLGMHFLGRMISQVSLPVRILPVDERQQRLFASVAGTGSVVMSQLLMPSDIWQSLRSQLPQLPASSVGRLRA